ncbi:unnamed protein product, partial [Durusdinium trenchii]
EWLRWFEKHPVPSLQHVAEVLQAPATEDVLEEVWTEVEQIETETPEMLTSPSRFCDIVDAVGRLLFHHFQRLPPRAAASSETWERRLHSCDTAWEAAAGLLLARDGTQTTKAIKLLARSKAKSAALRLAVAQHSNGNHQAVSGLVEIVKQEMDGNGDQVDDAELLLSMFGFLAATSGLHGDLATRALQWAAEGRGRGALEASLYSTSMKGLLPFALCQRVYLLERDLLFQPSSCLHRLELAVLLQQGATAIKEPRALGLAKSFLLDFPFQCPALASELSGMGVSWLDAPDAKTKSIGLAGDLHAVSAIRTGIRAANYALWHRANASHSTNQHQEVVRASKIVEDLRRRPPRRCDATEPPRPTRLFRPPRADAVLGSACPEVTKEHLQTCLRQSSPCVLRQAAKLLEGPGTLENWLQIAANATVRVSFPYTFEMSDRSGAAGASSSLNRILKTADLKIEALSPESPLWTLLRPGSWHMRFADAVSWAQRHPSQEIYLNQAQVADLGSEALAALHTLLRSTGLGAAMGPLQLLQPSLWLSSGVVTTGYHVDGPENLLIQVTGTKEVSLLKPSEKEKLQYEEVVDAEPQVDLTPNGEVQLGAVRNLHRRSRGHSLLDVAGSSAVPEEFLETYQEAQGISCQIHPGDVLYIPSGWHHAVFTVPDEHCVALSLNLWYHRPREEPTSTAKDTKVMASLEPLATFDVRRAVALEAPPGFSLLDGGEEEAVREHCTAAHARELSLTPSEPESQAERNADFLGRLHHFKNLFRMSATDHPVSVMIHKVGPMLILDDGPRLANRGVGVPPDAGIGLDHEQSLMLAELDPSLEMALGALGEETSSLASLAPELKNRLCVKNTFLDIDEGSDYESLGRAQSAPGRVDCDTPRSMISEADHLAHQTAQSGAEAVRQQLQEHIERAANAWSLIPYEPGDTSNELAARHWELLQCTSGKGNPGAVVEAVRSLFEIPPQPSRFGRAVEWRCGPYKILLGCDLVVMQSAEKCDPTDFASFKMLPDGSGALPSRDDRLDMYLENMMCDISKAVWGSPQGDGSSTWRVFNTADLPSPGDGEDFNAKQIHQHSQQLLHFLKQRCRRQGGTYWLFREANSSAAELFDLTEELTVENWDVDSSNSAFRTTPSLAPPIASLCAHLAQSMAQNEEKRQLLQKAVHLLEPLKEDHFGLYAMTALELASL